MKRNLLAGIVLLSLGGIRPALCESASAAFPGESKWIGRGVTGGRADVEALSDYTLGGDYLYAGVGVRTDFHLARLPDWTAGLTLPWKVASFEYLGYKSPYDATPEVEGQSGGFGDLGLHVRRVFGPARAHSLGLTAALPTGRHDGKRLQQKGAGLDGADDVRWLSPFVQPGSGLYSLGVTYEYTKDRDWGMLLFGGSFVSRYAWDNWSCREEAGSEAQRAINCQQERPSPLTWRLWELRHQGWGADPASWSQSEGAPGTGATGADVLSLYAHVGRRDEASVQSLGLTLNIPMSPTYYWDYGPGAGERVDLRVRTHDYLLKLSAGMEVSHGHFPLFVSVGVPWRLTDMADRGRFTAPLNYVGSVGVRGTFF